MFHTKTKTKTLAICGAAFALILCIAGFSMQSNAADVPENTLTKEEYTMQVRDIMTALNQHESTVTDANTLLEAAAPLYEELIALSAPPEYSYIQMRIVNGAAACRVALKLSADSAQNHDSMGEATLIQGKAVNLGDTTRELTVGLQMLEGVQ